MLRTLSLRLISRPRRTLHQGRARYGQPSAGGLLSADQRQDGREGVRHKAVAAQRRQQGSLPRRMQLHWGADAAGSLVQTCCCLLSSEQKTDAQATGKARRMYLGRALACHGATCSAELPERTLCVHSGIVKSVYMFCILAEAVTYSRGCFQRAGFRKRPDAIRALS